MKMIKSIKKEDNPIVEILIIFVACFFPKFLIALDSIMLNTISDETSAISAAAFMAGYDWRDVVSNAGYYGIGYLFLFFPLFKIGIPAVIIYRIILSCNAVLIGLTGVICWVILKQCFKIENKFVRIIFSCTCGNMSIFSTSISRARNEDVYLLCGWLFAYLFLKLLNVKVEEKFKYEISITLLLLYMLTIHLRAVTYIIAFIAVCGICWFFFHTRIVSKLFWVLLMVGYVIVKVMLKLYQQWVWHSDSIRNASLSSTVSSAFSKIEINFTMVKSVFMIIFAQLFTAFSLSGGIFIISFGIFVFFMWHCVKNRNNLQSRERNLFILSILYALMLMITICGQGITWGVKAYQGIVSGATDYIYAYKAFTYMRYMGSYVPVFVMAALVIIWNNWEIWKKVRLWTTLSFIFLLLFWIYEILPYVKDTKSNMEFFITIVSLPNEVKNSVTVWYKMFLLLFIILFIWMFFNNKKYFIVKLLILGIIFTGYERMEIFLNKTKLTEERNLEYINAGCDVIQHLHGNLLTDDMDICIVETNNEKDDHQVWYLYQFVNYDLHIIPGTKEEISQTDIILSNGEIAEYLADDYICFRLDENEYLYSKNSEYSGMIAAMGYEELAE